MNVEKGAVNAHGSGPMAHRIIATEAERDAFTVFLGTLKLPITVEWVQGRDRTKEQNRLQFLWAREAAEQRQDRTPEEQRNEWKLRFGVPILREDSPDFRETYDRLIRPLSYEEKLKAMDLILVTSLLKVRQMVRYLDAIERECVEEGVKLTDPDPELRAYHDRYRTRRAA
jgi:Fe-S cluster assembly scaffold protein SufB